MPFFDAEYLRNATRYRHSFNGIGTSTVRRPEQKRSRPTSESLTGEVVNQILIGFLDIHLITYELASIYYYNF